MRIVIALGGNALLKRGEPMDAATQRANVRIAAEAIAPIAAEHEVVVTHGNGPQVGLLALQSLSYEDVPPYPLDILGAETVGMIGYLIDQELGNAMGRPQDVTTVLTTTVVDSEDPAFASPTKFIGPVYDEATAQRLAAEHDWQIAADGTMWRRVVPSPMPRRIVESDVVDELLRSGHTVVCGGGGGIPVIDTDDGLRGVEAVVDKDRATAVLANAINADLLIIATDADAVYLDWGMPTQRAIAAASPEALTGLGFAAGSMGPKVEAAIDFAVTSDRPAVIGALEDLPDLISCRRGTRISLGESALAIREGSVA